MFKDYDKYLGTSLKVYMFLLVSTLILKVVGLDYFGLDLNNPVVLFIDNLVNRYGLINLYYFVTLYIYSLFFIGLIFEKDDKEIRVLALCYTIIGIIIKIIEAKIVDENINCAIDFVYLVGMVEITNIKYKKKRVIIRAVILLIINMIYQQITFAIREIHYTEQNSFVLNFILYLDYILMLLITYRLYFLKGGLKLCGMEVGYFSQKKKNFSNSLKKLQKSLNNFSYYSRQEKATYIIYFLLSAIWNTFTLLMIFLIARLNNTIVECIYIATSFWLSKRAFGKAFHLKSMIWCFVVSTLTYYILNRITTPLGISIIVPIMLGVGLSYITSKMVKKATPLYKGMPEDLFNESILKVVDKRSLRYEICYEYFIKRNSAINIAMRYHYSEIGIRKITERVNKKIRELR